MLYNIIISRTFYVIPLCHTLMWHLWLWHMISYLSSLSKSIIKKEEKKLENKIKEKCEKGNKRKEKLNKPKYIIYNSDTLLHTLIPRRFCLAQSPLPSSFLYIIYKCLQIPISSFSVHWIALVPLSPLLFSPLVTDILAIVAAYGVAIVWRLWWPWFVVIGEWWAASRLSWVLECVVVVSVE